MEKRLPLALFLSLLILLGWSFFFRPPPRTAEPQPQPPGSDGVHVAVDAPPGSTVAIETKSAAPALPVIGTQVRDTEERELTLQVGTPGKPGSYFAVFGNRGALLKKLQLGDSYDRVGLSDAEKLDVAHWTELLTSARSTSGPTGSLALRARTSAEAYQREPLDQALWTMRRLDDADGARPGVEFVLAPGTGVKFVKRVTFEPGTYRIHVQLELQNEALDSGARAAFLLTPAEVVPQESGDRFYVEPQAVAAGRPPLSSPNDALKLPEAKSIPRQDRAKAISGTFEIPTDSISFAGVHNKYFAVLLRAGSPFSEASLKGAAWRRLRDEDWAAKNPDKTADAWHFVATDVLLELEVPPRGETRSYDYVLFAGPKDREVLVRDDPDHEKLIKLDLGFFDGIARVLLWVLGFFQSVTTNWGVSIILLTVLVRSALFPVNRRSQTAMARYQKKMKRLQPAIDDLKKRYAKDAQKLRQEQATLMQKEGAFPPLGGCLPVFIQLPVFFGLFSALRTSYDLRQAPFFGWMSDLSKPDRLMTLGWHTGLPLIGTIEYLNILPPLMVVLWVLQQKMMPKPADEQAARMQKMMMFMPVVMGVFLYNYAAGLSLYMITQSGLGIVEQGIIKKYWPVDDTEPPPRKKTGFLARLAEKQASQMKKIQQQQASRAKSAKARGKK